MSRIKVLTVLGLVIFVLCGCSRSSANRSGQTDRLRVLEARCARLEQDYRTVATARDQVRKQFDVAQGELTQLRKTVETHQNHEQEREELRRQVEKLQQTLDQRTGERDTARRDLVQRTSERDLLQARQARMVEGVTKQMQQLQSLLEEANSTTGSASQLGLLNAEKP